MQESNNQEESFQYRDKINKRESRQMPKQRNEVRKKRNGRENKHAETSQSKQNVIRQGSYLKAVFKMEVKKLKTRKNLH